MARILFLYAPLFRTRHHQEFRLSRAVNMGTLPSRAQACVLILILAMNVALCTVNIPYGTDRAAAVIQIRTGIMATMNLIPLVLIAGYMRVADCLEFKAGWDAVRLAFMDSSFIRAGLIRAARIVTILYRNVSRDQTTADIESLPDDLLKIALNLPRPWIVTPGQHIYLYIPSISLWTSHPFSICWTDDFDSLAAERETPETTPTNQIYILMRRRTGFTDTLARRVSGSVNQTLSVHALVEGPYGGIHSLDSYGTVVLFAGGVGITHHLLYLRRLVRGQVEGTVAARRITLVWVVRSPDYLEWVEEWIGSIVSIGKGKERESSPTRALQILIYVTGSYNADGMERIRLGGSEEIRVSTGRPSFEKLLAWEMSNQVGAMGVLCCGNGRLMGDGGGFCK
ncbi:Ferric/cupric reductase transmembrane component 2 [Penicillium subrubescens]|uniref:ferric-chelate reductase (NADPH) n=1 Tax=Penicillium subrubescens TaxID=1316194 RepID=A0A1Q5UFW6_9EURO|nr:Ferric/cupric reductase transmembrane component 2 [Penicillium subrubescens]